MHLHTLTFQAIGPFDGLHTIDFSALSAAGLFLLEGPTGAGKSTIIDAVVFALYGGTAGSQSSAERLHSHHAAAGVEPFVELTFSTQAGIYRIKRTPKYVRPARRKGAGAMTVQNESVNLVRLGCLDRPDVIEPMSARAQEVGAEVRRLVGLSKEQFLQTVVLPQGEFAKFLQAKGEERKDLLRTIFRTEVYEQLTEQLQVMRAASGSAIKDAKARVGEALAAFEAAAQHEFGLSIDDLDLDAIGHECQAVHTAIKKEADAAQDATVDAQLTLTAAMKADEEQRQLATALAKRVVLLARQDALAAAMPRIKELEHDVAAARSAANVAMSLRGRGQARAAAAAAAAELASARAAHGEPFDARADLAVQRDQLLTQVNRLELLLESERSLPAQREQLQQQHHRLDELHAELRHLEEQARSAPALIAECEATLGRITASAQSLTAAHLRAQQARVVVAAAIAVEEIGVRVAELTLQCGQATGQARVANDVVHRLRKRRLDEYAGELSTRLVAGEPCAVCGSLEHPRPAQLVDDHPSDADIVSAEQALADATVAAETASRTLHEAERHLAAERAQSAGLSVEAATTAVATAQAELDAAQTAVDRLDGAAAALDEAKAAAATAAADISSTRVVIAALTTELASSQRSIDEAAAQISGVLDGRADSLAALAERLRRRQDLIDALTSALDRHDAAANALSARQREVDEGLRKNGFDSIEAAEAAMMDPATMARVVRELAENTAESTMVAAGLREPTLAGLRGDEVAEVASSASAVRAARDVADAAQDRSSVLAARLANSASALTKVRTSVAVHAAARAQSGSIDRLAGIAEGNHAANSKKVSLGTFVLMRRFEDVVNAANARYGPMSDGRYRLVHIEAKEGKKSGNRTGLALSIFDGETGQQREPRTLSGGETFNASLCLALGLADVVTGEAGGIELGTLFVDEGFGTLDSESLDRVMAELAKLSSGGRVVGIVSHVDELKQRVADRIEIRRKVGGASTLTVRADGGATSGMGMP